MDFSQLLSSGFQFLNLDDACEAEVDILTDMLFKNQDVENQLSKLFHLRSPPDGGDNCSVKYFTTTSPYDEDGQSVVVPTIAEHGDVSLATSEDTVVLTDRHHPATVEDVISEAAGTIPANGTLLAASPQHHVINVEPSPNDCPISNELTSQMTNIPPQPMRNYYPQPPHSHVPAVVHGSQSQVGSPAIGQPHGIGIVSQGYPPHVSLSLPMQQQQLIMMQAQAQSGQQYMPQIHYVPSHSQRHGHPPPPHGYQQGGPNKYSNGPRKNQNSRSIDRSRRNDQDTLMNNFNPYYSNIGFSNISNMTYYHNNQSAVLAHTVTGSPIIMPASHHSKASVPMFNPYVQPHYTSPPPSAYNPQTSPPESEITLLSASTVNSQVALSPRQQHHHHHHHHHQQQQQQQQEQYAPPTSTPPLPPPQAKHVAEVVTKSASSSSIPDTEQVAPSEEKLSDTPSDVVVVSKSMSVMCEHGVAEQDDNEEVEDADQEESPIINDEEASSSSQKPKKILDIVSTPNTNAPSPNSAPETRRDSPTPPKSSQTNHSEPSTQVKGPSPVPDQVQQKSNKCSSPPVTKEDRIPSQPVTTTNSINESTQVVQTKVPTWAATSAPKPQRVNSSSSSSSTPSTSSCNDDKALKDKGHGQNKSIEFPELASKSNINGSSSSTNNVSEPTTSTSTSNSATHTQSSPASSAPVPKGRSYASICKPPNAINSNSTLVSNITTNGNGSIIITNSSLSNSNTNLNSQEFSSGGSSGGSASDNTTQNSQHVTSSDNNGRFVPIQSQSDKPKSSVGTATASNDPTNVDLSCLNDENDSQAIRLGEFLANYALDHHAQALTPRGLTNQSNFCYINATLQALMACPPFVNLFRSMRDVLGKSPCKATPIIQSVFDFVSEFEPLNRGGNNKRDRRNDARDTFVTGANLEPTGIRKVLGLFEGSTFKVEGRQQDAEEFLCHLLNGLHDEMIKVIKWYENTKSGDTSPAAMLPVSEVNGRHSDGNEDDDDADHWQVMGPKNKGWLTRKTNVVKSPISEMLFGQLCSALHRTNSFKSATLQPFFTLQLDIQSDSIRSVREALEGLTCKEEVSGIVSNSGQETEAWRQLSLEELPMILILHLKRFVYDKSGHKIQKLDKRLDFNIDLEIAKELVSQSSRNKCTAKQRQYKLFAVVYHDGEEAYKGHYIADCFHPSGGNLWGQVGWLRYDDITVKPIAENVMLNAQPPRVPYLLYYRRADTLLNHHVTQSRKERF